MATIRIRASPHKIDQIRMSHFYKSCNLSFEFFSQVVFA